jgi:hypothetical protein
MSAYKSVPTKNDRRLQWTEPFPLQTRATNFHDSPLLKLVVWSFVIAIECISEEVAAAIRISHERRQRKVNEGDFERLMASDPHFARDLDIPPERKLSELH